MDAALSLTPARLSRGDFQLWIEKDSEEKSDKERVRVGVPLKGASPFVGSSCNSHIYLNSNRKVDLLRVLGYSQQQRMKCGREMETHEIKKVLMARNREECLTVSPECFPPVGKDND